MRNERLRALLLERGKTPDQLADAAQVDAKTVERWITKGRIPYRRHRFEVATFLGVDESYIWPDALGRDEVAVVSESEVVAVYPHRSEVPRDVWGHLFSAGRAGDRRAGVLRAVPRPRTRASRRSSRTRPPRACGCGSCSATRTARSWPTVAKTRASATRMAAKIRNALALYRPLRQVEGVEFRLHRTVLYNSIYRADDQVLVNTHLFGVTAPHAPVWHLRKLPGGELAGLYLDSFERVWETATPLDGA